AECGDLLGVLGDPLALPRLHAALEDWDAQVRLHAIRSIGRLADAGSVTPLLAASRRSDENEENQLAMLRALGSIATAPARAGLRKVLRTPEQTETVRAAAFAELWRNRRAAAGDIVGDVDYALGSKSPRLVYAGAVRAAVLGTPRLASALRSHIDDGDANI